ncbi:hypothetical protein EXN66_Car008020 [Channa argus]|uniref:Uncharacterized protein n=1 Tax=Channa argus TaxID=215402 RepID=A0A6G1PQC1_CHAAH|nr:hypothetical protein EXN66_Car008020 [Channa argus]
MVLFLLFGQSFQTKTRMNGAALLHTQTDTHTLKPRVDEHTLCISAHTEPKLTELNGRFYLISSFCCLSQVLDHLLVLLNVLSWFNLICLMCD